MPSPPNPFRRVVDAATRGPESLLRLADVAPRVVALLDTAERAMARVVVLLARLEQDEERIQQVVSSVAGSERAARRVIDAVAATEQRVDDLVESYAPALRSMSDTVDYASTRFGPQQVDELVAYLGFLPMLRTIDREVVPMMQTLTSVAPDLTELLAVSRALNELMGSLPGLGRAKKRVDEELAREQDRPDGT